MIVPTTTTPDATPGVESPLEPPTGAPEGGSTPERENGSQGQNGNREARYRVERNEARAERDSLIERLTQLQTRELHRLAGELLAAPEDIELSGRTLADYLTPEGWVDHEAVAEAAAAVIESRPGLAKNPTVLATDRTQGQGSPGKSTLSWAELLK